VGSHDKAGKREEVLNQGLRLMNEQGYHATGVKEIVDAAGIPKGSFYNYFENKEDLLIQALKYHVGHAERQAAAILGDLCLSPLQRMRALIQARIQDHTEEVCRQGCFVTNICHELAATHPKIATAISEHLDRMRDLLAACVAEGQVLGEIGTGISPPDLAEFIENGWDGALTRAKARRSREPLEAFQNTLFEKIL
jgi:TetR/AcrR family transcriptional repressor of nem operon